LETVFFYRGIQQLYFSFSVLLIRPFLVFVFKTLRFWICVARSMNKPSLLSERMFGTGTHSAGSSPNASSDPNEEPIVQGYGPDDGSPVESNERGKEPELQLGTMDVDNAIQQWGSHTALDSFVEELHSVRRREAERSASAPSMYTRLMYHLGVPLTGTVCTEQEFWKRVMYCELPMDKLYRVQLALHPTDSFRDQQSELCELLATMAQVNRFFVVELVQFVNAHLCQDRQEKKHTLCRQHHYETQRQLDELRQEQRHTQEWISMERYMWGTLLVGLTVLWATAMGRK
jgi:hypothetical protein